MKFFMRIFNVVCDWMFDELCEKVKNGEIDKSITTTICSAH
jgi:hypothetical protein